MEKRIRISNGFVNANFVNWTQYHPDQTIVVFLHEALGSIGQWKDVPQRLCDELSMPGIVIERIGYGKSDEGNYNRNERYLHDAAAETAEFLRAILPKEQPLLLFGHSDGGTITLLLTAQAQFNIKASVVLAAHTFVEPETIAGIEPAVSAFEQGKLNGLQKYHGDKTARLFYAWANTWRAPYFANWSIEKEMGNISTPILVFQGKDDQYGTLKQYDSLQYLEASQLLQIERLACGHHPHLEAKETVLSTTKNWYLSLHKQTS